MTQDLGKMMSATAGMVTRLTHILLVADTEATETHLAPVFSCHCVVISIIYHIRMHGFRTPVSARCPFASKGQSYASFECKKKKEICWTKVLMDVPGILARVLVLLVGVP